jgi:fibronectin type 3 domain-containing protein
MKRNVLFALLMLLPLTAQAAPGKVVVVFEDARGAFLRWPLAEGPPPETVRVERRQGTQKTIVANLRTGDGSTLNAETRDLLVRYKSVSRGSDADKARLARGFIMLRSIGDLALAQALGIFVNDPSAPAGASVTYDVYAGSTLVATSGAVTLTPTPAPIPPPDVEAAVSREELRLSWSGDESTAPNAAVVYDVYRALGTAQPQRVSPLPIFAGASRDNVPARGSFVDKSPVLEQSVSYFVVSRDGFGRESALSAPVTVMYPDYAALEVPKFVKAEMANGAAKVSWTAAKNANRRGFKVYRSLNPASVPELLTQTPVTANEFIDTTAKPGVTYYYAVAAVSAREDGNRSDTTALLVRAAKPPAAPTGITVAHRPGSVLLEWPAIPGAVGYRVERALPNGRWSIVNDEMVRGARIEDVFPIGVGGTLSYRVSTVGVDDQVSVPSQVVAVELPDVQSPLAPIAKTADGRAGRVTLTFRANSGENVTDGLFVLRSRNIREDGLIVHAAPLPANATSYVDEDVVAGSTYIYRLVAIDTAGNRSEPSEPLTVTVGAPPLPTMAAPKLQYEATPFPAVKITFPAHASPSIRTVVQRKEGDTWLLVAGPTLAGATEALDTRPPKRAATYRVVAVSTTGEEGDPSPASEIKIP